MTPSTPIYLRLYAPVAMFCLIGIGIAAWLANSFNLRNELAWISKGKPAPCQRLTQQAQLRYLSAKGTYKEAFNDATTKNGINQVFA